MYFVNVYHFVCVCVCVYHFVCVCAYFPFVFEDGKWDLIVLVLKIDFLFYCVLSVPFIFSSFLSLNM